MEVNITHALLVILSLTLLVTVTFKTLRLPVILGYIVVGVLVGPNGAALLHNTENIKLLSEFGIVFLMFTVGLKFSLRSLWHMKSSVFIVGGMQVLLTTAITTIIGVYVGMPVEMSIIIGGIAAMSSTAIVLKQLSDQGEMESAHGHNAVGVLLFQDLAVIPFIVLVGSMAQTTGSSAWGVIGFEFLYGVLALLVILIIGRWVLQPLFHVIASTKMSELLTLAVLLIVISSAIFTERFGLSYAFGAFMAGMMLSETAYRHQVQVEIRPFKDVLLGLFFITVGMLLDLSTWPDTWQWIALLLVSILIGKGLLVAIVSRCIKFDLYSSVRSAVVLSQGSEFGFAILTLALGYKIIPEGYGQVIMSALLLSMAIGPLLVKNNDKITKFLLYPWAKKLKKSYSVGSKLVDKAPVEVVICGYGRFGQQIGGMLHEESIPFLAIDNNPRHIRSKGSIRGEVIYGDATHPELIRVFCDIDTKVVVVCLDNLSDTVQSVSHIRKLSCTVPIMARCRANNDIEDLLAAGANIVVPETLDSSFMMMYHIFSLVNVDDPDLEKALTDMKNTHDNLLNKFFGFV